MNRKLMLGIAAFLAVVGIALTGGENKAQAGFGCGGGLFAKHGGGCGGKLFGGGGLFAKHRGGGGCSGEVAPPPSCPAPPPSCGGAPDCGGCGGGLFARLKAKHAARKAARKSAASCCGAPDPCCAPAPEPCCAPAPEPNCAPEPCCAPAASVAAPCCGAVMEGVPMEAMEASPAGVNEAGEQIVPGSVQVISDGAEEAAASASDSADGI